ncbi:MAG TPA: glutaredoxin family protein, partial [Cyanobacteria bacterium UBA11691]|nr:glutaredoxin family protein [Cyanobacteria bacterium UBA11691]
NDTWWQAYEYEIPVLVLDSNPPQRLPRLSPRGTVAQLEKMLQRFAL